MKNDNLMEFTLPYISLESLRRSHIRKNRRLNEAGPKIPKPPTKYQQRMAGLSAEERRAALDKQKGYDQKNRLKKLATKAGGEYDPDKHEQLGYKGYKDLLHSQIPAQEPPIPVRTSTEGPFQEPVQDVGTTYLTPRQQSRQRSNERYVAKNAAEKHLGDRNKYNPELHASMGHKQYLQHVRAEGARQAAETESQAKQQVQSFQDKSQAAAQKPFGLTPDQMANLPSSEREVGANNQAEFERAKKAIQANKEKEAAYRKSAGILEPEGVPSGFGSEIEKAAKQAQIDDATSKFDDVVDKIARMYDAKHSDGPLPDDWEPSDEAMDEVSRLIRVKKGQERAKLSDIKAGLEDTFIDPNMSKITPSRTSRIAVQAAEDEKAAKKATKKAEARLASSNTDAYHYYDDRIGVLYGRDKELAHVNREISAVMSDARLTDEERDDLLDELEDLKQEKQEKFNVESVKRKVKKDMKLLREMGARKFLSHMYRTRIVQPDVLLEFGKMNKMKMQGQNSMEMLPNANLSITGQKLPPRAKSPVNPNANTTELNHTTIQGQNMDNMVGEIPQAMSSDQPQNFLDPQTQQNLQKGAENGSQAPWNDAMKQRQQKSDMEKMGQMQMDKLARESKFIEEGIRLMRRVGSRKFIQGYYQSR